MKALRYKISTSTDVTLGSVAGLNVHGWSVPPAVPIPAVPTVEYPLPNFWPPGSCMGQNKLTRRVTHRKAAIVQDGHDVGMMIPHLSMPAFNVLMPIHVLFSKRKAVFFEPSVRFERRFAAPCSALGLPPTPMMSCNDPIGMPIASTVTDHRNTVELGMSIGSYLLSYAAMAVTVCVDSCFKRVWGTAERRNASPSGLALLGEQVGRKLAGGRRPAEVLAKIGLEAALGIGKVEATEGDRTVSISTPGGPFVRLSRTDATDGQTQWKGTLHGLSTDGGNAWDETWRRTGHDGPWGADLG